ncbi:fumarylacetoacetate hydrolase [Wolfiporia cocos MD-104 SS10]|uniref:Fumarylacetoacetate hydrolase n=1 Tax=Wolfiporia cocos (strain MD-104) TaxID=742152 RepID=A0A2H3JFE1_WOLCO|nr:fumarylacetoacetate hydrolase [Wolfiporia cocos MD-104 SS10]
MAPIRTQWTRLIRFVAVETGQVHLGEPVDPNQDVGLDCQQKKPIYAYEILGSAIDPAAQVTKLVLTVKELLAPLARDQVGGIVRCLGLNYADHAIEANLQKPSVPVIFYKAPTTLIGPGAVVTVPKIAQPAHEHLPDYEVELVIVIGKAARDVSEADALDYVLGYTGANDVSFRKLQLSAGGGQWGFSKSFDDTNPIGPCIVAASAIPDPQRVPLKCVVNGQTLQNGSTADQIFNVRQTIAYLSQGTTLLPGSLILTGTPAGVGFVKKPPLYLKGGDNMHVWLGNGIGTLANLVVEEDAKVKAKL